MKLILKTNLYSGYNILFINYFLFLYLILIFAKEEKIKNLNFISEITIEIKGTGNQAIISDNFSNYNKLPDTILINGNNQNYTKVRYVNNLINEINNITLKWSDELTDCSYMFYKLPNIISIDLSKFNSSNVTDMKFMFGKCTLLNSINLNNLNTSKVISMRNMFDSCINLQSLNLSNLDTSSVTEFTRMFYNCSSLITIDLNNFNTISAYTIQGMFRECNSLISLDLSSFNTSNANLMMNMFNGCKSLTSIDLSSFNTSSVTRMDSLFKNCNSLIALNLENFNTLNLLNYNNMFYGCNNNLIYCINKDKAFNISHLLNSFIDNCTYFCVGKKMINGTKKCIDYCYNDENNKYEYENVCYKSCPSDTNASSNYICEKVINEENNKDNNFYNIFKNKNNTLEKKDIIISIKNQLLNGNLESLLSSIIDGENDLLFESKDIIYQIISTNNQNNNDYNNISVINLGQCENKLKSHYNISKDEPLIIFKIDIHKEGLLYSTVEYEIYNSKGNIQLDLNICNDTIIEIYLPVLIDENNIFKHNSSSEYYNDICFTYTTENGTDIILNDRKNEFINNNLSICEDNCELEGYDSKTIRAKCDCKVKKEISLISEISSNKKELLKKFTDVNNIFNVKIIECHKLLFSTEGLKNNICSYILLSIIFINIISCILFILKGYKLLYDEINKILEYKLENNKNNNKDNIQNKQKEIKKNKKNKKKYKKKAKNITIKKKI